MKACVSADSLPEKQRKRASDPPVRGHSHAFGRVDGVTTASGCQDVTEFLQFSRLSRD